MLNSNSSQAKTFFDDISIMEKEKGFEFLKNLIDKENKFYEQDWIDFKGAEKLGPKDMKKIWSKAISGYANSCDGIIVWGIDARKDKDTGIDYASALSLVDNPEIMRSQLQEFQRQSTDPPVRNIEYCIAPDSDNKGFVVCFIPESPFKPYRADAAGRNYYIRAGDSFQVPSVSLLKRLFYPEFHACLWPELRAIKKDSEIIVEGYIHNSGVGTAKNVVIAMETVPPLGNFSMVDNNTWRIVDHMAVKNNNQSIAFLCTHPIHPGIIRHFFHFTISQQDIDNACIPYHESCTHASPIIFKPFIFKFLFYSEDNKPQFSHVIFNRQDFDDFIDSGKKNGKGNTNLLKDKDYNTPLSRIPIS